MFPLTPPSPPLGERGRVRGQECLRCNLIMERSIVKVAKKIERYPSLFPEIVINLSL
jgi:hypothetical protein